MQRGASGNGQTTIAAAQELGFLAWLVIVLGVVLLVAGVVWHGVELAVLKRLWHNLVDRPSGPMTFRFILQPSMAVLIAFHDGRRDARAGRSPYLETLLHKPQERTARLREGLNATARIVLLALAMDVIYQVLVLDTFFPNEALIISLLLVFIPYAIVRGLVARAWRGARTQRAG